MHLFHVNFGNDQSPVITEQHMEVLWVEEDRLAADVARVYLTVDWQLPGLSLISNAITVVICKRKTSLVNAICSKHVLTCGILVASARKCRPCPYRQNINPCKFACRCFFISDFFRSEPVHWRRSICVHGKVFCDN